MVGEGEKAVRQIGERVERGLLEAIERLVEVQNGPTAILIALKLGAVPLTVNGAMKEGILDVTPPHHQSTSNHDCKEAPKNNQAANRCACVTIADMRLLDETFGNEARL